MGTDDLFKKRKIKQEKRRRNVELQKLNNILIVCEGEKTEPNYFNSIIEEYQLSNITLVKGLGENTDCVTEYAIKKYNEYSKIWCVFDRDSFSKQKFNRAFQMTKKYPKIHIAYSNEAFELWYVLHFDYLDTAISREQYYDILDDRLGKKYHKNSETIYAEIKDKLPDAIKNAKQLMGQYKRPNPEKNKPSTNVYELVEELIHCGNLKNG